MDGQEQFSPTNSFYKMTDAWVQSSKHLSNSVQHLYSSVAEANRAFLPVSANGEQAPDSDEVAYTTPEWTYERTADTRAELGVGDSVRFTKQLTDEDVRAFAQISGDTNRLHLDEEFAEKTRFGRRIVHGTLVSGLISAALARLPGMTIYLSQDVKFKRPVDLGNRLTAVCEIVEDLGDDRYRLTTIVENEDEEVVIDGEAVVIIDEQPDDE